MRLLLWITLASAVLLGAAAHARAAARPGDQHRAHTVRIEAVRGDKGSPESRSALADALARHLKRLGFNVIPSGKGATYRLQPSMVSFEAPTSATGASVEVKASVVALDRKGRVAAMVEGGARAQAAPGIARRQLESQAVEAAGRSIAEDLARRLLETH